MYKLVVLATVLAAANAGLVAAPAYAASAYAAPAYASAYAPAYAPAAVTSQQSNILRSYGNLGQVSTYSKTIDTPYSSVTKSDVRVSNPGYASYAAPAIAAYSSPALHHQVVAAPALHSAYHTPVVAAAPAYHTPVVAKAVAPAAIGVAYSAAPAVAHLSFDGLGTHYGW